MPAGTVPARIDNIRREGADVIIHDGSYDETVMRAATEAARHSWQIISDTAYDGYTAIPDDIMCGYATMYVEIDDHLDDKPLNKNDIIILQAGVGSFPASATAYYKNTLGKDCPKLIAVEPTEAACLYASHRAGMRVTADGSFQTIMAGLNCGTPSLTAWPILERHIDLFMTIDDDYARRAMRMYYNPIGDDPRIISGESGAAGLGALLALMEKADYLDRPESIGEHTRVLIFNTEGDTDPDGFRRAIEQI